MPTKARRLAQQNPPYYRRYIEDFGQGVREAQMSLELIGFYSLLLDEQWRMQGPLDDDPAGLAKRLRVDPRTVRRLTDDLVALGPKKLSRADGKIWNPRMQKEIHRHFVWTQRLLAKQSGDPFANPQRQLPLATVVEGGLRTKGARPLATALSDLAASLKRRGGY